MISAGSGIAPGFVLAQENALETLRQLGPDEIEFYSEARDIVRFS